MIMFGFDWMHPIMGQIDCRMLEACAPLLFDQYSRTMNRNVVPGRLSMIENVKWAKNSQTILIISQTIRNCKTETWFRFLIKSYFSTQNKKKNYIQHRHNIFSNVHTVINDDYKTYMNSIKFGFYCFFMNTQNQREHRKHKPVLRYVEKRLTGFVISTNV